MRTIPLLVSAALVFGACAADAPVPDTAADAAAAEQALGGFFAALEEWSPAVLRSSVTNDFELVEDTAIFTIDEFVQFVQAHEEQGARMTFQLSDHNTEVSGDVAWIRYVNRAAMTMQGQETRFHWLESAVLTRQPDGTLLIDRLQSNPVGIEGAMTDEG